MSIEDVDNLICGALVAIAILSIPLMVIIDGLNAMGLFK